MSLFQKQENQLPSFGEEPENTTDNWWANIKSFIWETLKVVIISLIIIIPVRYFIIQPFYVQGSSMEPNFFDSEYLIIDEISYRFSDPKRGDIVVFRNPLEPRQFFIKRIIGLPGEQVQINDSAITIFNTNFPDGMILEESSYLPRTTQTSGNIRISLNLSDYYVLGDNRGSSLDSRRFGSIEYAAIIGKVWLRGWPLSRIQVFETPVYNIN